MENKVIEDLTAVTTKSYETIKSLGDINSNAFLKMADLQLDMISMNMESSIEQAKSLISMTEANDIFSSNAEMLSDYSEKLIGFTNQTVEILTDSRVEATNLIEKVLAPKAAPAKKPVNAKTTKASAVKPATKKSVKEAA